MSWQDNFTAYTTGWAFNLSLTRDQVSCLAHIADMGIRGFHEAGGWRSHSGRSTFIPIFRALERRGLAEHNPAALFVGFNTPGVTLKWVYRLTPAGEHVLALLRLAGVTDEQPATETEASERPLDGAAR